MELLAILPFVVIIVVAYKRYAKQAPKHTEVCPKCETVVEHTGHLLGAKERQRWLFLFVIGQALIIGEIIMRYLGVDSLGIAHDVIGGGATAAVLIDWWADL